MSREIKFRAWDNVKDEMYYVGEEGNISFGLESNGIVAYDITEEEEEFKVLHHLQYLQYTGVNDQKGNPIYEGDIVHVWEQDSFIPNRDSGGGIIDYDCKDGFSQLGVVSFKGAWYTYETKQHLEGREEQIYAPLDFTNDLFVVGNIYENADLIQGGRTMKYTEHGTYEVTQLLAETKETEENGN